MAEQIEQVGADVPAPGTKCKTNEPGTSGPQCSQLPTGDQQTQSDIRHNPALKGMAPFRWPELSHDVALAIEVMATRPDKAQDWENIAEMLSGSFSSADKAVVLKGRGCRDRMDLLLKKYKTDDAKALKKSGTEEDYGSLHQLLEDIASFYEDFSAAKDALLAKKAYLAKRKDDDKRKGIDMRKAAMEARTRPSTPSSTVNIDDAENVDDGDDDDDCESAGLLAKRTKLNGKTTIEPKRTTRISLVDLLAKKHEEKQALKKEELEVKRMELDLQKRKWEMEEKERKQRLEDDAKQRSLFMELMKKQMQLED